MPALICPVSAEMIDKRASRVGATLTALLLIAGVAIGSWPILVAIAADYSIRVLTPYRAPIAVFARSLVSAARIAPKPMNKGPKIFAWRVGFLMAVAAVVLIPISLPAALAVAAGLAAFNILDGVFNLCVGCVVYTDLVLPYLGPVEARAH